jgi:hypothetical protein
MLDLSLGLMNLLVSSLTILFDSIFKSLLVRLILVPGQHRFGVGAFFLIELHFNFLVFTFVQSKRLTTPLPVQLAFAVVFLFIEHTACAYFFVHYCCRLEPIG